MRWATCVCVCILGVFVALPMGFTQDLTLSWDPVPDVEKYGIWRSDDVGASWTQILTTTGNETTITLSDVPTDKIYLYEVSSIKGGHDVASFWTFVGTDYSKRPPDQTTGVGFPIQ